MNEEVLNTLVRLIETDNGWFCLLDSNVLLPVDNWFDEEGDPCEPEDAWYCVAGADDFGWMTIELHDMLDKEKLN